MPSYYDLHRHESVGLCFDLRDSINGLQLFQKLFFWLETRLFPISKFFGSERGDHFKIQA